MDYLNVHYHRYRRHPRHRCYLLCQRKIGINAILSNWKEMQSEKYRSCHCRRSISRKPLDFIKEIRFYQRISILSNYQIVSSRTTIVGNLPPLLPPPNASASGDASGSALAKADASGLARASGSGSARANGCGSGSAAASAFICT